jgi:predicted nucleotidyltransferase
MLIIKSPAGLLGENMGIRRLLAKKINLNEAERLIARLRDHLIDIGLNCSQIILFGSAARGELTDQSDLDVLLIFPDQVSLKSGKAVYYGKPFLEWSVDAVFVCADEFLQRAQVGGVCLIAYQQGRVLYRSNSSNG